MSNFEFETRVNNTIRHSEQAEQRVKAERTRLMRGAGEESPLIKKSAFSLMEMMTVMLVVSVIMALSAPMITKKNAGDVSIRSLWTALTGGNIGYNTDGVPVTAIIGGGDNQIETMGTPIPRLTLATNDDKPHIGFMYGGSVAGRLTLRNNGIELGNGASIGTDPDSSVAIGNNAKTTKHHAVAIGRGTEAALGGVAVGDEAKAEDYAVAIGDSENSSTSTRTTAGTYSVALGYASQAGSTSAVAIGNKAITDAPRAIVIGSEVNATGSRSIAIGSDYATGYPTEATASSSIAIGQGTKVSKSSSIAMGELANVIANNAIAVGCKAVARANDVVVFGNKASTAHEAERAIAIGRLAQAKKKAAIAIGSEGDEEGGTTAEGENSVAIGTGSWVSGLSAIGIGRGINTHGNRSIVIGDSADTATAGASDTPDDSIAIGTTSKSKGSKSIAIGLNTSANKAGIAIGSSYELNSDTYTTVANANSIAIGVGANATGTNSIAIGSPYMYKIPYSTVWKSNVTKAGKTNSIAIGIGANAGMPNSIAIGQNAYAAPTASSVSASDAIAIGSSAKATGKNSIAIGGSASADDSIAIGGATSQKHQIVLGTKKDVVYIPGHLVVGGQTWLGVDVDDSGKEASGGSYTQVYVRMNWDTPGETGTRRMRHQIRRLYEEPGKPNWISHDSYSATTDANGYMPPPTAATNSEYWKYYKSPNGYYENPYSSDRRLKDIIGENLDAMDKINKLKVYNYTYKKDDLKTPHVGVVAQELEKIFPNAISKDENGFLQIRHEDMFYAMINALKELDAKIKKLATEVTNGFESLKLQAKQSTSDVAKLNARIDKQDKEIKALKKEIAELKKLIK